MKVPMFIAKKILGRSGFSETRLQTDGYGYGVPYVKQKHANMCADACMEMLSQYFDWGLNIDMSSNPRDMTEGLSGSEVLQAYGTRVCWSHAPTAGRLEDLLRRKGPIMCAGLFAHMGILGDQGHWILIKGADGGHFWTHDPWHGANVKVDKADLFANLEQNSFSDPSIIVAR